MNPIARILEQYPVIYLDGATATELEAKGFAINDSLWSAKILYQQPEAIRQLHRDYLKAGADICTSVSYQATVPGFLNRGFSQQEAKDLIRRSVELVKGARDDFWADPANRKGRPQPVAAASVGPYGAYLADGSEYRGNYAISREELADFHRERMALLVEAGAELLACETIPCLEEAVVLAELVAAHPDMSCWISFSCKDETHISDGTPIQECAAALARNPCVAALGINCTAPEYVEDLIRKIKLETDQPVVVYPNSGEQYDPVTKTWHGAADGLSFHQRAVAWHRAGAVGIGGCCRTSPSHIAAVVQAIPR